MPRRLPQAETRRIAVRQVIASNLGDGYAPTRFIQATEHGEARDLVRVCEHLILNPDTLSWLVQALEQHRGLLFLEDLVAEHGYGLPPEAVNEAKMRVKALNDFVGGARWVRGT